MRQLRTRRSGALVVRVAGPAKPAWEEARALIESETGPVSDVQVLSSGRNSEISVIVCAAGEATFVKGRRAGHPQAWTQEREKAVNLLVQHVSPRLKWAAADNAWSLLGYEPAPYWSTRSLDASRCTSWELPATRMPPAILPWSVVISATGSPDSTVALFHAGSCRVLETTYFGIWFIFAAKPASSLMAGQAAAKPS